MPDQNIRRRILVVDDEERMVRFIRMNLEHDGYQVTEALNGSRPSTSFGIRRISSYWT